MVSVIVDTYIPNLSDTSPAQLGDKPPATACEAPLRYYESYSKVSHMYEVHLVPGASLEQHVQRVAKPGFSDAITHVFERSNQDEAVCYQAFLHPELLKVVRADLGVEFIERSTMSHEVEPDRVAIASLSPDGTAVALKVPHSARPTRALPQEHLGRVV